MDKILEKVKEYWKMIVLVVCGLIAGGIFYVLTNGQKPTTNLSVENLSSVSRQSSVWGGDREAGQGAGDLPLLERQGRVRLY